MSNKKYIGACLCGKVRFEISNGITDIVYCHCSECRKAQGSAFASNGYVDATGFVFLDGASELTAYQSSSGQTKYFCKHCGSPIISKSIATPNKVRVRLGTIETDISERAVGHIFVRSKANWEQIEGDLPQYDEYEPSRKAVLGVGAD